MRSDVVRRILMLIPLGTWRINGHLDVVAAIPWLSVYTKFIFAENGNLSLPVLSTIRVRKIRRKGPILSYLYCGVLLHNVVLDRWLDFQSLQLTEEPPEDEEEDPFTAKLMSFEVRLQLLKSRRVLSVEAVLFALLLSNSVWVVLVIVRLRVRLGLCCAEVYYGTVLRSLSLILLAITELRWKLGQKSCSKIVPQCNATQHRPSLTQNPQKPNYR